MEDISAGPMHRGSAGVGELNQSSSALQHRRPRTGGSTDTAPSGGGPGNPIRNDYDRQVFNSDLGVWPE